jgi:phage terminase Nu1 subunit (DNA packaging protein)
MVAEGVPWKKLAVLLDMEERTIRKYEQEGIFVKVGRGQYLLAPSVRNYVRRLREIAAGRRGNELNAVDENARLKIAMRKNYELKNAALEGRLISIAEMTDAWSAIVRTIKAMVLSIPARCQEKLPHLPFEDVETIRKVAHKVLAETSRMMPNEPPIPDGPDATIATPRKRGRPPGPSTSLRP